MDNWPSAGSRCIGFFDLLCHALADALDVAHRGSLEVPRFVTLRERVWYIRQDDPAIYGLFQGNEARFVTILHKGNVSMSDYDRIQVSCGLLPGFSYSSEVLQQAVDQVVLPIKAVVSIEHSPKGSGIHTQIFELVRVVQVDIVCGMIICVSNIDYVNLEKQVLGIAGGVLDKTSVKCNLTYENLIDSEASRVVGLKITGAIVGYSYNVSEISGL